MTSTREVTRAATSMAQKNKLRRGAVKPAGAIALGLLFATACGGSPALRAAERSDYAALRAELVSRVKSGRISTRDAADVARVVATQEVTRAKPPDAVARVREVRACAADVDDALAERMKTPDEAGALAALVRLEDGRLDASDARRFASSSDDGWRAVGVRALSRPEDHEARARAIVDPSPEVRRAAIRAVDVSKDASALGALFEAARVDPEPLVRTQAVRAMAAVASSPSDVAFRLRDLWVVSDDPVREDIAAAWASPLVFAPSGRQALRTLLDSQSGPGVIAAAGAILRAPDINDPELETAAREILVRTIGASSRRNRLHAIAVAPLGPKREGEAPAASAALLEALRKASHDEDVDVSLGALARLTASKVDRDEAVRALETMAGQSDRPDRASRARLALATAGDARIQAWIEGDLTSEDPLLRLSAVDALAALGRAGRAAVVLADANPSVRTRAACAVLLAARVRR